MVRCSFLQQSYSKICQKETERKFVWMIIEKPLIIICELIWELRMWKCEWCETLWKGLIAEKLETSHYFTDRNRIIFQYFIPLNTDWEIVTVIQYFVLWFEFCSGLSYLYLDFIFMFLNRQETSFWDNFRQWKRVVESAYFRAIFYKNP